MITKDSAKALANEFYREGFSHMTTEKATNKIEASASIAHGHLDLEAKPVSGVVCITGHVDYYPLLGVYLTPDAAIRLANQLTDAVDELELADGIQS